MNRFGGLFRLVNQAHDSMRPNTYDQLPYPTRSHPAAHIRKLEAVATLFGMHPQAVSNCRVLELGSASAFNLIPQTTEFPQSSFVGVELSKPQIEQGQSIIATLGLDNVELRHADLLDIDASWGQFDYILCHGVYSWVPENVRKKILVICKENISPDGVALVSHNVLPGWHFRGMVRDMMLYHTSRFEQPEQQVSQARAVLDFVADNCTAKGAYGQMLREEVDHVRNADDQYLFHDHLEDHNHPFYFHQFVERAEAGGLQFLSDTNVASMFPTFLSPEAKSTLANAPLVAQQQYMDFLSNRAFRSTLLCHQSVAVTRDISREVLRDFQLSLAVRPEPFEANFESKDPVNVRIGPGTFTTHSPLAMAVVEHLSNHWPRPISIDELHSASVQRLSTSGNCGESFDNVSVDNVVDAVMGIFTTGLCDFCLHPPAIANQVSSRPLATRLARLQASSGGSVTNLRHENVMLDEFSRFLVALLDSHHSRGLLFDKVQTAIARGDLTAPQNGQPVEPPMLDGLVGEALTGICHASLLTA